MVEQGLWEWQKQVNIIYHSGKKNQHTDCLSCQAVMPTSPYDSANIEIQIAKISSETKNSGKENTIGIYYTLNIKLWRKLAVTLSLLCNLWT